MSLKRLQKIQLNILDKIGQVEKLVGKEGDNLTRGLEVQLLNNNIVVDDISDIDCTLIAKQRGAEAEDTFVVPGAKVDGKYEIIYPSNLMKKGIVEAEIRFTQDDYILTSFIFKINMAKTLVVEEITDSIYEQRLIDVIVEVVANEEQRIKAENKRESSETIRKANEEDRIALYELIQQKLSDGELNGKNLEFDWNGTQLGVKLEGEEKYQYVNLKGTKGDKGDIEDLTKKHVEDAIGFTPAKKTELESLEKKHTDISNEVKLARGDYSTLDDRFNNLKSSVYINVEDYGAKGDGKTDDSKSIQQALDAAENEGGGVVYMPTGEYIIGDALLIGSNVNLLGAGKSTILNATKKLDDGSSTLYNKGRGGKETYNGASNFSIENLSVTSTTRERQGLYFDNAVDFRVSNIWGLGKTLDHYIDINNSKNGLFENVYLTYDPQGTAAFQIDSREGQNDGLTVRNLQVTHPNYKFDPDNIQSHDAAIHFHRVGANNIDISNVTIRGMNVGIYKDPGCVLKNVRFTNFKMINCSQPINFTNSGDTRQKDIIIKDWIVESSRLNRPFGYFIDIDNLTIEDISIQTNQVEKEHAIRLSKCSEVKIGGIEFSGDYKPTEEGKPLSFIRSSDSDYSITKSITGHWLPEVGVSGKSYNVEYSRQFGAYTIIGNMIHLTGRLTIESVDSNDSGYAYILNPPAPILADSRPAGSIGLGSRFKGEAKNLVISGADLELGDVLRIHPAMTDEFIDISELDDCFFSFSISYIFE